MTRVFVSIRKSKSFNAAGISDFKLVNGGGVFNVIACIATACHFTDAARCSRTTQWSAKISEVWLTVHRALFRDDIYAPCSSVPGTYVAASVRGF